MSERESANAVVELKGMTRDELGAYFTDELGEKKFRADQVWAWMYDKLAPDFASMTNLSKSLRANLTEVARASSLEHQGAHESPDGTVKLTFRCDDRSIVETVYIPSEGRNTLCISSQVGCAMGCTFCWTAKMGLHRHLTAAEIVDQVVWARRLMGDRNGHIGNIVFMGMGEPLHNYDAVVAAIEVLTDERGLNFSRRKITVSTSGLVPALERLGHDTDVNIAISLNATTDEQRSAIMPVNDRWPIAELIGALRAYPLERRQRITIEYVMIEDFNDTDADAERLIDLLKGLPIKVNLIPFNPHPKSPFRPPSEARVEAFKEYLTSRHVSCFRRKTRGQEEMAACGQLGEPGERREPAHVRKKLAPFREAARNA